MSILFMATGLILLVAGGDTLVRGSVAVAERLGVSKLMIGLTLVGFGTSTPELVTSLQAVFSGSPGIAVGNAVGSNIANILLILGIAGVVSPIHVPFATIRRDGVFMLGAAVLMAGFFWGGLARWEGGVSVLLLIAYIVFVYRKERRLFDASAQMHRAEAEVITPVPTRLWLGLAMALGGLLLTVLGAYWMVRGATMFAREQGVSEAVIGLSIIAVGTSLPELVTSLAAAWRRQADVAFGNVLGSNIYNMLGILGVTALAHPIDVPAQILRVDVWVMLALSGLILWFSYTGRVISRREAAVLLGLYTLYIVWLAI